MAGKTETSPPSAEKLSSVKVVPGAQKVGDCQSKRFPKGQRLEGLYFRERKEEGLCRLRGHVGGQKSQGKNSLGLWGRVRV